MNSLDEKRAYDDKNTRQKIAEEVEVEDVFVERDDHQIHYKTLSWQVIRRPFIFFLFLMFLDC